MFNLIKFFNKKTVTPKFKVGDFMEGYFPDEEYEIYGDKEVIIIEILSMDGDVVKYTEYMGLFSITHTSNVQYINDNFSHCGKPLWVGLQY